MKFYRYLPLLLCLPLASFCDDAGSGINAPLDIAPVPLNSGEGAQTNAVPEQAGGGEQPAPPPVKEPVAVSSLTYFVRQNDTGGRGSAFLLEDEAGVWLVSNSHVFGGSTNLSIINVEGRTLEVPDRIEVAKDRDIIRFRTTQERGLRLSPSCEYEEAVCAYGDSGGAGVLTRLEGKAIALGPDRVEISAEIIPGNSGGPVVNTGGEVIGVSSYLLRHTKLPDWITDGTRFTDTRRMALKLKDVEWVPVDFPEFYRQTQALDEFEDALHTTIVITDTMSRSITRTLIVTTGHRELQAWVKKHNQLVKNNSPSSQQRARHDIRNLVRILRRMQDDPALDGITIPYLKGRLDDMLEACEATRKKAEALSD